MELKQCACGCGELISPFDLRGRPKRFKIYHGLRMEHNHKWKGGRYFNGNYWLVKTKDHPFSDMRGYVMEHRLIMEYYLSIIMDEKIFLSRIFEVHHINGIKTDNRIVNLEILTKPEHTRLEKTVNYSNTICLLCGSKETYIRKNRNNRPEWYRFNDGYICNKCKMRTDYSVRRRNNNLNIFS